MNKFMLSITASSGEFYQGDCEDLTLPISDGIYGVQAGHNPVLVALHMGILHFVVDGKARDVLVGDGIAEVTPAYVMVLVDSAENPEDIDKNRAEAARIRAEERLQHKQSMHEYYQTKIRYGKLHQMCIKYEAGTLDFEPSCSLGLLTAQKAAMGKYLQCLEVRAQIEDVKL